MLDDLRAAALADRELALGDRPPPERTVDGSQLRSLCVELDAAGSRQLSLRGGRVVGQLDLAATTLNLWLTFRDCEFEDSILLVSTRVASFTLERCTVPALIASHLTVETELDLSQSTVGRASLALSRLGGLLADGAVLGTDPANYALRLESAHVEDDVILTGASVTGTISLQGVRVGGAIRADRAQIEAGDTACTLDDGEVSGDVRLRDGFRCVGVLRGVGARIAGSLVLDQATLESPDTVAFRGASIGADLVLRRLQSHGRVSFDSARIERAVFGERAVFESTGGYSLSFRNAEVGDMIHLGGASLSGGPLLLSDARIGGDVYFENATCKADLNDDALTAVRADIAGNLDLTQLNAVGKVLVLDTRIGGSFNANDASVANTTQPTVDLVSARIGNSILLVRFQGNGPVQIRGTRIGGDVVVEGASLAAPGWQAALYLAQTEIEGTVRLMDVRADGIGILASHSAILDDDVDQSEQQLGSWVPGDGAGVLRLDGFRYDSLSDGARRASVRARIRWLRATEDYEPRSWLQLAATLRAQGRDSDASRVLVEMQNDRLRRGGLSRPAWLGHQILRLTIGHGYRSWLAGVWATAVIALFAILVSRTPEHFTAATGTEGSPQPVAYSVDTFLPIVDLGEASRWLATGWVAWAEWCVILVGWALTTIFVAGFTRVVRSP